MHPNSTPLFRHKETVEICSREGEGFPDSYYAATLLAAIGKTRFLIRYKTRFTPDRSRFLTAIVDAAEVRPTPPETLVDRLSASDRVDAFVNSGWRVGEVVRKVDPNYYVRLDGSKDEYHCPFYRVRLHLDWEDGTWVYHPSGHGDGDSNKKTTLALTEGNNNNNNLDMIGGYISSL